MLNNWCKIIKHSSRSIFNHVYTACKVFPTFFYSKENISTKLKMGQVMFFVSVNNGALDIL